MKYYLLFLLFFRLAPIDAQDNPFLHIDCQESGYGDIISVCYLDSTVTDIQKKAIFDTLYRRRPEWKFKSKADPSLQWILDVCKTKKTFLQHPYFLTSMSYRPLWLEKTSIPENYAYKIYKDTLYAFQQRDNWGNFYEDTDSFPGKKAFKEAWITYYAYNHKEIVLASQTPEFKIEIYTTNHAVIVKKKNKYSWAFVTDGVTTGGPEKLRWKSIHKIIPYKDYLFILQNRGIAGYEKVLFVVNYNKGTCKLLDHERISENKEQPLRDFLLENNKVILIQADPVDSNYSYKEILIKDLLKNF